MEIKFNWATFYLQFALELNLHSWEMMLHQTDEPSTKTEPHSPQVFNHFDLMKHCVCIFILD